AAGPGVGLRTSGGTLEAAQAVAHRLPDTLRPRGRRPSAVAARVTTDPLPYTPPPLTVAQPLPAVTVVGIRRAGGAVDGHGTDALHPRWAGLEPPGTYRFFCRSPPATLADGRAPTAPQDAAAASRLGGQQDHATRRLH